MQDFTEKDLEKLEAKLNPEISNNDTIMFIGLSGLIIVFAICAVANEIFPKETLKEYSLATIVSLVWFIVRQQLMIHRADGYLELWREIFQAEAKQEISPNTYKVRPAPWEKWRIQTDFRILTLVVSSLLSGSVGILWLFRWWAPYPDGQKIIYVMYWAQIMVGMIMIFITPKLARIDGGIRLGEGK